LPKATSDHAANRTRSIDDHSHVGMVRPTGCWGGTQTSAQHPTKCGQWWC
jgi:hypothetical protein